MTYENQIKALELKAIKYAEKNLIDEMIDAITEMMLITDKYLGITNEYLEDKK